LGVLSSIKDALTPVKNRVHNLLNRVRVRKINPGRLPALTVPKKPSNGTTLTVRNLRGPGDEHRFELTQSLLQLNLFNGELNSSALKEGREEIEREALWNAGLSEADFEAVRNTDENPAPQETSTPQTLAQQRISQAMEGTSGRQEVLNTLATILREQGTNIFDRELLQITPRVARYLMANIFEIAQRLENSSACRNLIRNLLLLPSQFREAAVQRLRARVQQTEQTEWESIPEKLRQEGIERAAELWRTLPEEIQERISAFNDNPDMTPIEFILQNFYELERAVPNSLPRNFTGQLAQIWVDIRARSITPPSREDKHITPHTFVRTGDNFACGVNRYQLTEESGRYFIQRGVVVNADGQNIFIADPTTSTEIVLPSDNELFGFFNIPEENGQLNIVRDENGSYTFSVIDKAYFDGLDRRGKAAGL
jgi:hypothetical protein